MHTWPPNTYPSPMLYSAPMKTRLYGIHSVQALLETRPSLVSTLYLQENRQDERLARLFALAEQHQLVCRVLTRMELSQLAGHEEHQGVVAECVELPTYSESDLPTVLSQIKAPGLLLVLDGVQDPHNLGACLRSANALGAQCVIVPKNQSVGMTPVVRKVACGAAEMTPLIQVTNLARTLRMLQEEGYWLVGAVADAEHSLVEIDLKGNVVLVMGGEGSGMRRLTQEHCDFLARIPMQGGVSSLNVSTATAIALYEVQRQRASA